MEDTKKWKDILKEQSRLHPAMEPQDVCKLIYQAAFGAEHLLENRETARDFFQQEYERTEAAEGPLCEQIYQNICRVNLGAWKWKNLPADWLFQMFAGSAALQKNGRKDHRESLQADSRKEKFRELAEAAGEAAAEGYFPFSADELAQYALEYGKQGLHPVHHSEGYRRAEKPGYRLADIRYLRLLPILEKMAAHPAKDKILVLAIDGRCASGKTTMADMLSEITGAGVVHMDDFFLPMELRTKERLSQPGGNVHYERFREEVLPCLREKRGFAYGRFDCGRMELCGERFVGETFADGCFRIVEGAYSMHPFFGDYADLKVFSDITAREQSERILKRDGGEALTVFRQRWIPMEERYFTAYHTEKRADIIV